MRPAGPPIQKDQPKVTTSLRGRKPVAIRNPCGAMRRPAPEGPERCGLPRRFAPRNDSGRWWLVPLRRECGNFGKPYCGTVITVPYRFDRKFPKNRRGDSRIARRFAMTAQPKQKDQPSNHHVIARGHSPRGNPHLSGPSGTGRCFAPQGLRIATGLRPRNDRGGRGGSPSAPVVR